jgi:hypothetical protein
MRRITRLALLVSAALALGTTEASAQVTTSGSAPLSVLTPAGRVHDTTVTWRREDNELVVTNVTRPLDAHDVADLFDTLRMQLSRATAINLRPATARNGCCATMSGGGVGFAGNSRATLSIEQRLEGPDRVVQTVVIRGYNGPPLDGSIARMLFQ